MEEKKPIQEHSLSYPPKTTSPAPKAEPIYNTATIYQIEKLEDHLIITVEFPFLIKYFSPSFLVAFFAPIVSIYMLYTNNLLTIDILFSESVLGIFAILGLFLVFTIPAFLHYMSKTIIKVSASQITTQKEPFFPSKEQYLKQEIYNLRADFDGRHYVVQLLTHLEYNVWTDLFKVQTKEEAEWFCSKIWSMLHP